MEETNKPKVSIDLLTDEAIIDYTREGGKDRVLNDHRDLDLRRDFVLPIPGGIFDIGCFGSPIQDRCLCGKIRRPSPEPCPNCGARVYTTQESLRKFARIELPFYYLNSLRFEVFKNLFDDIFKDVKIVKNFRSDNLKEIGYSQRSSRSFGMKVFDTCQFDYNNDKKELTVTEFITDETKCSYEGLLSIIEKYFPNRVTEFKRLINRYYIVQPPAMRPFTLDRRNSGNKRMGMHKLNYWYSIILRFCCVDNLEAKDSNYENVMARFKTPGEKVRYTALLRSMLNSGRKIATELLNTSKKNKARDLYVVNTKNSARCAIVPSTTLAIDEIGFPKSIAYELCRGGFIDYLMKELNFSRVEALKATRLEYNNPETEKMFKEYAEKQIVLDYRYNWYVR